MSKEEEKKALKRPKEDDDSYELEDYDEEGDDVI
jgi:hypothetical protein